jgi:DNA polymerase I-like protein with 3'-5' exonuclease and polymerase domains
MNETPVARPLVLDDLNPRMNVTLVQDDYGLGCVSNFFTRKKEFGLDLETNVVSDLNERFVRCIQVGDRDEQYVIDLLAFSKCVETLKQAQRLDGVRKAVYGHVIEVLRPALESREWLKIGHNLQFEYENLRMGFGLRAWHFWDTCLAERVILCGLVSAKAEGYFALDDVLLKYGRVIIDKSLQRSFELDQPITQDKLIYAALDTRLPLKVKESQTKILLKDNLMRTAQVEFDAIPAFGDMRVHGFYVDSEPWLALARKKEGELREIIKNLDAQFIPIVGLGFRRIKLVHDLGVLEMSWRAEDDKTLRAAKRKEFMEARSAISHWQELSETWEGEAAINYGSNQQLRLALLKFKCLAGKKLKDTNDKTLEKLKGIPVIDLIRKYREVNKAITTYGANFLTKYRSKITGRLHSNINQIGAETGRTSSDNPNIQNIPGDEEYRSCFIARPGYKTITIDVSGCELRICASDSGEPVWLEAFNKDWDVHSLGAEYVYPLKWKEAAEPICLFYLGGKKLKCDCKGHGKIRKPIKSLNFGVIYGLSETGYARDTGKGRLEAREDLRHYANWIPVLWKHLKKLNDDATWKLESRTRLGRRRAFHRPTPEKAINNLRNRLKREPYDVEVRKELARMWSSIGREGMNAPIQGGNSDLMKLAIGCGFDSNGKPFLWHSLESETGAMLENMVHDEIVIEAPEKSAEKARDLGQDAILRAGHEIYDKVDMETEACIADCWKK